MLFSLLQVLVGIKTILNKDQHPLQSILPPKGLKINLSETERYPKYTATPHLTTRPSLLSSLSCVTVFAQSAIHLWLCVPSETQLTKIKTVRCPDPWNSCTPHCTRLGWSVFILMPAQLTVAGPGKFLYLARMYALGFLTLNVTVCHISSWVNHDRAKFQLDGR